MTDAVRALGQCPTRAQVRAEFGAVANAAATVRVKGFAEAGGHGSTPQLRKGERQKQSNSKHTECDQLIRNPVCGREALRKSCRLYRNPQLHRHLRD